MDYTKQLIKAINDLTKAVNKNTEAIREDSKLNELDINTVESGTPDDFNRWLDSQKAYQPENIVYTTDGLGNSHAYKKGVGGILYSGNKNIGKAEFIAATGEITLTEEDQERLFDSLNDKGKKFK